MVVSSLVSLACGLGQTESTGAAETETGPTGSTSGDDTEGGDPTDSSESGGTTLGDGATDTNGATDDGDDCEVALDNCPDSLVRGCPYALVGTNIGSDRILGLTCVPACPGPITTLELYDPVTAQRTSVVDTQPEIVPTAVEVAADGSVIIGGGYKPSPWEGAQAGTLHRVALDGTIMWNVQIDDATFQHLVVLGDDILGFGDDAVSAFSLADGSPTWTLPVGLSLHELAAASDGTLYVYGWDGVAPFQGLHVLAFDSTHAPLWDFEEVPVPDQNRGVEGMIVDETGGLILVAQVTIVSDANEVIEVRKLDANGNEIWSTLVDAGAVRSGSHDDRFYDVVARAGGGAIVVGRGASEPDHQPMAVAFDANGNELWMDLGDPGPQARLAHAVRVGDQAYGLGCGSGEWMVAFAP